MNTKIFLKPRVLITQYSFRTAVCSKTEKATISHKKQVKNESVTSSPKWVSPLVCVPRKNGNVCLRVDMCKADTAIIRNYYPIPTSDQILYEVNGAKFFSLNLT